MPKTVARFLLPVSCENCGVTPGQWVTQTETEGFSGVPRLGKPVLVQKCARCGTFVTLEAVEYKEA